MTWVYVLDKEEKNNMVKKSFELPLGWLVMKIKRRKGFSRGKTDKHYYSPNGDHFKSLIGVERFLKAESERNHDVIVIVDSSDEEEVIVVEECSSPWV